MLNCYYAHADTEEGAQVTPHVMQAAPDMFCFAETALGETLRLI